MWNRREAAIKIEILEFSGKHPMIFLPNIKTPPRNIKHPEVLNISTRMKTGGGLYMKAEELRSLSSGEKKSSFSGVQ